MRPPSVLLLCVLAGCATPPAAHRQAAAPRVASEVFAAPPQGLALRVGVEYLPPTDDDTAESPLHEASSPIVETTVSEPSASAWKRAELVPRGPEYGARIRERRARLPWSMAPEELNEIRDPMERATLQLIEDLMGEDRRRIVRELGTPILATRHFDATAPQLPSALDEQQAQEEDEFMNEQGGRLLRRPLRNLLKDSMLVRSLEGALEDFKADNVPLSDAYQSSHPGRSKLGRMSVRVHLGNLDDPVEMVYMNRGWRFGGSREKLKAGYRTWITDTLSLDVRSRYTYEDPSWGVRGDLTYYLDSKTRLHVVAGDDLEFLATSNLYSLFESPIDGSPGVLFYVVHLF